MERLLQFEAYASDPALYIERELGVTLWSAQKDICRLLLQPPYRVLCKACHKVGKSFLAACLISWFYDTFNPSLCLTTAPSEEAIKDQLWRQVRLVREAAGKGGFRGAHAPELWSAEDHWAKGLTAAKSEAFHGRHAEHMLFVIDEGVGVESWVFQVMRSMFKAEGKHFWLVIGNPTNTSSQMYAEELSCDLEGNPAWHQVQMSALDHPNITLHGPRCPAAVSQEQFRLWLAEWTERTCALEATATDLEWPPGSGQWYRPGPEFEARALGRWPTQGTRGIWSDGLWQAALRPQPLPGPDVLPEIGADIARFGDDFTEIHVRVGPCSLAHEWHNGWSTVRTAGRLKELAREWTTWATSRRPPSAAPVVYQDIKVKVDDGGVGGGVTDQADGYWFVPVLAQSRPCDPERYDSCRSELWFVTAERARRGQLDLSRLPRQALLRLRQQAMAPLWKMDGSGRRQVERKEDTKKRLSIGSPDAMDALNLAFYAGVVSAVPEMLR